MRAVLCVCEVCVQYSRVEPAPDLAQHERPRVCVCVRVRYACSAVRGCVRYPCSTHASSRRRTSLSTSALGWTVSRLPRGICSATCVPRGATLTRRDPRSTRRTDSSNGCDLPSERHGSSGTGVCVKETRKGTERDRDRQNTE